MKYLITGGAGFIGSHLASHLLSEGHDVHVIDNFSTGSIENIQPFFGQTGFGYTIGNVLDYHTLERKVEKCDVIVHLAAAVGVRLIMEEPVETIVTNVQGTENVLKLANYHRKKVMLASTSEVYGKFLDNNNTATSLSEDGDCSLGPTTKRRWAYACSKALDEFLALAYHDEKNLDVVILRFFNTVGPRQSARYGMVIPNFVQSALRGEPIRVFGNGEQSRCFTHVNDAVRTLVQLVNVEAATGEIYNIGTEEEITINRLAKKVNDMVGSDAGIVIVPYDEVYGSGFEDMFRRTPNIEKIRKAVGYEPKYSIDNIVSEVIEYYRALD